MDNNIIIILGMHRSGTSVLANWLQQCGICIGDSLMQGGTGNEEGHFEDLEFVRFHEKVFKEKGLPASGLCMHNVHTLSPGSIQELQRIITKKNAGNKSWAWKDPRTCLFLYPYRELLPGAKYIVIVRNYQDCILSLMERNLEVAEIKYLQHASFIKKKWWQYYRKNKFREAYFTNNTERYIKIWIKYNTEIFTHISKTDPVNYCIMAYETFADDIKKLYTQIKDTWGTPVKYADTEKIYKPHRAARKNDLQKYVLDKAILQQAEKLEGSIRNHTGQKKLSKDKETTSTILSNQPLVTIVAVSFNQEKYVTDTLNSILHQTYKNIQLIIADDGSTDGTKALIEKWIADNKSETVFINHPRNKGVTKNLNSALPFIKGKYYQFVGCEDILFPDKIEKQVYLLESNPQTGVVYSDMQLITPGGIKWKQTHYQYYTDEVPVNGNIYDSIIFKCFITTPSVLMRTEVLRDCGGDNELLDINDYDFWIRASKKFNFLYHDDVTILYRVVPDSLSRKEGITRFKNNFLVFYLNYDKRKQYRPVFDRRLLYNLKNLAGSDFKYTSKYALNAFSKTKNWYYLLMSLRYINLYFTGAKK